MSIVAIPQWLSKQARWEVLRSHVGQIGQLAASVVDGDLHRKLLDPANYSPELYATALKPLVRFHSANSDLFYVYTMVDRDHSPYFILDTATSSDLRTKNHLRASGYMEPFKLQKKYEDGWLDQIAAGKTYVTPTYEHDDYGYFLTRTCRSMTATGPIAALWASISIWHTTWRRRRVSVRSRSGVWWQH